MAYEFRFPDIGQGITEGEIVKWHVKEGEYVKSYDEKTGKFSRDAKLRDDWIDSLGEAVYSIIQKK